MNQKLRIHCMQCVFPVLTKKAREYVNVSHEIGSLSNQIPFFALF